MADSSTVGGKVTDADILDDVLRRIARVLGMEEDEDVDTLLEALEQGRSEAEQERVAAQQLRSKMELLETNLVTAAEDLRATQDALRTTEDALRAEQSRAAAIQSGAQRSINATAATWIAALKDLEAKLTASQAETETARQAVLRAEREVAARPVARAPRAVALEQAEAELAKAAEKIRTLQDQLGVAVRDRADARTQEDAARKELGLIDKYLCWGENSGPRVAVIRERIQRRDIQVEALRVELTKAQLALVKAQAAAGQNRQK